MTANPSPRLCGVPPHVSRVLVEMCILAEAKRQGLLLRQKYEFLLFRKAHRSGGEGRGGTVCANADALHLHPLLVAGSQTRLGRAAAAGVTN